MPTGPRGEHRPAVGAAIVAANGAVALEHTLPVHRKKQAL